MRRRTMAFLMSVVLIGGGGLSWTKFRTRNNPDDFARHNLQQLYFAIREYSEFNGGKLPPNLLDALKSRGTSPVVFERPDGAGTFDYEYVDWSSKYGFDEVSKMDLPLIYKRGINNNGHHGVFIIKSNESFSWDADGSWLRAFASEHPETKVIP